MIAETISPEVDVQHCKLDVMKCMLLLARRIQMRCRNRKELMSLYS